MVTSAVTVVLWGEPNFMLIHKAVNTPRILIAPKNIIKNSIWRHDGHKNVNPFKSIPNIIEPTTNFILKHVIFS